MVAERDNPDDFDPDEDIRGTYRSGTASPLHVLTTVLSDYNNVDLPTFACSPREYRILKGWVSHSPISQTL